jgi:hypothetical protein
MQFFTREWATGELTDDQYEAAFLRYSGHLDRLKLPASVLTLAECPIHDGLVERVHEVQ